MFTGSTENPFVCLNDITTCRIGFVNPVIYNPLLSPELNKMYLHDHILKRFTIDLSENQLNELCCNNLTPNEFIQKIHKMLFE